LFLRQATKTYRLLTRAAHSIIFVLGANHLAVFKRVRANGSRLIEGLATGESPCLYVVSNMLWGFAKQVQNPVFTIVCLFKI
jgi:hypothetical protein